MERLQVKEKYTTFFLKRNKYTYLTVRHGNVIKFVVFHDFFCCSPFVTTFTIFQ